MVEEFPKNEIIKTELIPQSLIPADIFVGTKLRVTVVQNKTRIEGEVTEINGRKKLSKFDLEYIYSHLELFDIEVLKDGSGAPSIYTQELADNICELLATGMSLRSVCREEGMPHIATVFRWIRSNKTFCEQYTRAKEESADAMVEDILDIADDGTNDWMTVKYGKNEVEVPNNEVLQRSRLRVDTRKWIAGKMKPKKYGDKIDLSGEVKIIPAPIYGGQSNPDKV